MDKPEAIAKDKLEEELKKVPDWKYEEEGEHNKITRELVFESFPSGVEFINEMADYFEGIDHHPNIHIYYKKIFLELQRWDAGDKLTDRDIEVAQKIDKKFSNWKK